MKNFYALLRVPRDATKEQIRSAYRQLALQTHPDQPGGDPARFREVREAYETLVDEARRAAYETARTAWLAERNWLDCPRCGITLAKYRVEGVGTRCRVCKTPLTEWTAGGRLKIRGVQFLHGAADLAEGLVAGSVEVAHAELEELVASAQKEFTDWLRARLGKGRLPR